MSTQEHVGTWPALFQSTTLPLLDLTHPHPHQTDRRHEYLTRSALLILLKIFINTNKNCLRV
jgi:hypothetical protein